MYLKIRNQNIYFQKIGKGKDLVMLHGWGVDVSTFWGVVDLLKNDFTLWLIDLPGFGRSGQPKKNFTVSDYAEIIGEFIKKNKIKKPVLLGHSLGGRVAIKLASHLSSGNVNFIDKLILESSAGIKPKRDNLKPFFYLIAKLSHVIPNWISLKEKIRVWFYKSLESDYINAGVLKETLKNILDEDLTKDVTKIQTDILLIWGEKDPTKEASLKNGKKMYHLIKNSRIEILEDVGHFPHIENPERFVYWVKDFCLPV